MFRRWMIRTVVMMVVVPAAAKVARLLADRLERRRGESAVTKGLRKAADKGEDTTPSS